MRLSMPFALLSAALLVSTAAPALAQSSPPIDDPNAIVEELPFMGVVLKKQADLNVARRHLSIRARRAAMHEGSG